MLNRTISPYPRWNGPLSRKGSQKKQLVLEAIDLYLHQDRSELDQAIKDRDQARSEADQRWREPIRLRAKLNQIKRELETARSREDQLRSEIEQARSLKDQVSSEAEGLRRDIEHYKDTLAIKDKQISFLEGHVPSSRSPSASYP